MNDKLNFYFTGTPIDCCHDVSGITIYCSIMWNIFLMALWANKAFVKWFQIEWNYFSFLFFWAMRLSFPPMLHYNYNYQLQLFLWFLLFSIFFGLVNTVFLICCVLLFLQTFFSVSTRLNILPLQWSLQNRFLIHNFTNCSIANNQILLFKIQFDSLTEVKFVTNGSPLSCFFFKVY